MPATSQSKPTISYERSEFIRCLAENIAEEHQSTKGTDLDSILIDTELELLADTFSESFDGLLIKDKKGYRVVCNLSTGNTPASPRGRFTIAHELGHYFIDEHRDVLEKCLMPSLGERAIKDNVMEREADLFASRLLLPTQFIRKAFKKTRSGLTGIREISTKFCVSMKCAAIRYVSEDITPSCIIFRSWESERKWNWISRSAWLAGMRKVKAEPIDKGATHQVISRSPEQDCEILDSAATARYFFSMGDGQNSNEIFKEESMALGEHGVLTLLTAQKQDLPVMANVLDRRYSR